MAEDQGIAAVETWLQSLGLGKYAQAFRANDVDIALLPQLTADDLKDLGVTSVGHRRTLLSAAAALSCPPVKPTVQAEQRIVTAMFCDLVGSTPLSTTLDPEDYRDLIALFRTKVTTTLASHHGAVDRFLGDGIVAFFGLVGGQDHAAEHAVAAGLGILATLGAMPAVKGHKLQVRIGLATGLTVTSGPETLDPAIDAVVGETPNLAARLQAATEPDTILISQATRDRLGDLFALEDVGVLTLKGISARQRAFRVLGHANVGSRFEALHPTTSAALVGRAAELARLVRQSDTARTEGRLVVTLITGDSGLGKSRLAREAMQTAGKDPAATSVLQCTPYHTATPFLPLRRFLGRRLGQTDAPMASFLAELGIPDPEAPDLLAGFLTETADEASGSPQAAQARRGALLGLLTRLLSAIGTRDGLILIEDVHWLDPTTAELLARQADVPGGWHLIATTRTAPLPDWCHANRAEVIALDRLPQKDFAALIRAVAKARSPGTTLTDAETEEIALRCDHNPVFAEELTRFWLERAAGTPPDQQPALPASLSDSLMARLDRLAEGRRLAQVASVIGLEFPVALLRSVSNLSEAEADKGIAALIGAGVLQPAQSPLGPSVGFRHTLLQDAAYMTLLRRDRTTLHGRIADTMTGQFPALAEALPQVVAHHLSRAARPVEAAELWQTAGRLAARRSAYAEAAAHLRRSVDDLARAAKDGANTGPAELQARISLASALIALHGFGAAAVRTEMQHVEDLGASLQLGDQLIPLLVPQWAYLGATGQHEASIAVARRILSLAASGTEVDRLLGHRALGTTLVFAGRLGEARTHLLAFMDLYDSDRHEGLLARHGTSNHAAMTAVGLAEIAALQGDAAAVARWSAAATRLAGASGQGHDLCNVTLFVGCILPALDGRLADCAPAAERLAALSVQHALPLWDGYAGLFRGIAALASGKVREGESLAAEGMAKVLDAAAFLRFCLLFHAEACLAAGLSGRARESLVLSRLTSDPPETWLTAEVLRLEAMLAGRDHASPDHISALLDRAAEVADRQGAHRLGERIAATRSRLLPARRALLDL